MQSAPKQDTSRKHLSAVPGAGLSAAVCGFCLSKSGFMIFLRRKSFTADPYTEIFQHGCPHSLCKNPWSRSLVDTSPGGVALQIFQHVCPHSLCRNPCSRSLVDTSSAGVVLQILQARLPTQSLQKPLFPQSCRHVLWRCRAANLPARLSTQSLQETLFPQACRKVLCRHRAGTELKHLTKPCSYYIAIKNKCAREALLKQCLHSGTKRKKLRG